MSLSVVVDGDAGVVVVVPAGEVDVEAPAPEVAAEVGLATPAVVELRVADDRAGELELSDGDDVAVAAVLGAEVVVVGADEVGADELGTVVEVAAAVVLAVVLGVVVGLASPDGFAVGADAVDAGGDGVVVRPGACSTIVVALPLASGTM